MKPALWIALAASLGLSAWLALQPDDETQDAAGLVVAVQRPAPAAPARPAARPNDQETRLTGPEIAPATASSPLTAGSADTPALPARAADWPMPPARALLAWGAPPPPPAPVAARPAASPPPPPERPRAPAFPYQWIGTLDDGRGAQALLGGALRGAAVRAGQVLDGQWRVERIREQQIDLTWLPGAQSVSVRGASPAASGGRAAPQAPDNDNPEADPAPAS